MSAPTDANLRLIATALSGSAALLNLLAAWKLTGGDLRGTLAPLAWVLLPSLLAGTQTILAGSRGALWAAMVAAAVADLGGSLGMALAFAAAADSGTAIAFGVLPPFVVAAQCGLAGGTWLMLRNRKGPQ